MVPGDRDTSSLRKSRRGVLGCAGALMAIGMTCATSARADDKGLPPGDLPAGELRCAVQGGFENGISANRVLNCRYDRSDARAELYTGYTGITGLGFGQAPDEALVYQVYSAAPRELAALDGNFKGSTSGIATARSGDLTGGRAGDILLRPALPPSTEFGAASNVAPINAIAGFGYLHLIYNGVIPARQRRRASP